MLLVFGVFRSDKKVHEIKGRTMDNVLKNYVKYCKANGFKECIYHVGSFGNSAWQNKTGELLILRPEN